MTAKEFLKTQLITDDNSVIDINAHKYSQTDLIKFAEAYYKYEVKNLNKPSVIISVCECKFCEKLYNDMEYYLIEENELTKQTFDLDEILAFQLKNNVQIIRSEDYQYMCYINKSVYATGLTPMFALSYGIKNFKERS